MSKVVHNKKEPFDVYIGRPSKWGNPFSHQAGTLAKFKVSSRDEAVAKFEEYLLASDLMKDLHELKGKVLGCWCAPLSCHGDVLVKWANREYECLSREDGTHCVHWYDGDELCCSCGDNTDPEEVS